MKKITLIFALSMIPLLTACTTIRTALVKLQRETTVEMHAGEYVLWAEGEWCEWGPPGTLASAGSCGGRPSYPPGVYVVDAEGRIIQEDSVSATVNISTDELRAEGQRECGRFQAAGVDCAPNFVFKHASNDPLWDDLWGLGEQGLNITPLWELGDAAPDIKVVIIDTGIRCSHEDIQRCSGEYNAIENSSSQIDDNGHGTHCAGTVGAIGDNGVGVSGTAKRASLFAAKFLRADGSGSLAGAARAIQYAIEVNAHIISASWSGGADNAVLRAAMSAADRAGILFVAAAGNAARNLDSSPRYPANYDYPNVITVGSYESNGEMSHFSNYGIGTVEVFAPGGRILSTWNNGSYKRLSGTSMATPHISGLAAILWQRELGNGSKREQMIRVRDAIYAMGTGELRDKSRFGIVRAQSAAASCKPKKCRKCVRACKAQFNCNGRCK